MKRQLLTKRSDLQSALKPKVSKYRNEKVEVDGEVFDSKHEAKCWCELKLREKAGEISGLERQHSFAIEVNDVPIGHWIADFCWWEGERWIVADAKGLRTPLYRWQKALMRAVYGIIIIEL